MKTELFTFHRPKQAKVINAFESLVNLPPPPVLTKAEAEAERNRQLSLASYHRRKAERIALQSIPSRAVLAHESKPVTMASSRFATA